MREGIIKKMVADRGFGFIAGDRQDVFFHFSAVQEINFDDLQEGQVVHYEVDSDEGGGRGRGPRASLVKPA
ncbi:MAG: cold shock domain-containing protein [Planctomycetes bacterium]|nr:cold shock domain-containing protein [Planctomycetota bacterium]